MMVKFKLHEIATLQYSNNRSNFMGENYNSSYYFVKFSRNNNDVYFTFNMQQ